MKRKRTRGKNRTRHTMRCDWCAVVKETTRKDTKTCSGRCRSRMAFYVNACGYPPDGAPGPVTGQDAVDLEVLRLLLAEKRRRDALRIQNEAIARHTGGK